MVTTRTFVSVVLALGAAPAVALSAYNGFFPSFTDISDPLGRPSAMVDQLIGSADRLDEVIAGLEPKHGELSSNIQVLGSLSNDLGVLAGKAGELPDLAKSLNGSTTRAAGIAGPLPDLLTAVAARSDEAAPTVTGLSTAVGSVATELQGISSGLTTIQATLAGLGPKSTELAATLSNIEQAADRVRLLGPVLAVIGPAFNSLGIPSLGIEMPPLPPPPTP